MLHRLIDHPIGGFVETFGLEDVANGSVGIFFKHKGAQDGFFKLFVARRNAAAEVGD